LHLIIIKKIVAVTMIFAVTTDPVIS